MHLIFHEQSLLLVKTSSTWALPNATHLTELDLQLSKIVLADTALVAQLINPEQVALNAMLELVNLRQVVNLLETKLVEQVIFAQQMLHYQRTNNYCAQCGSQTMLAVTGKWLYCARCQREIYPQISPAMIVAVTRGDKILLAQAKHFAADVWSVLAGFCEVGENVEQTVAREVLEEVGIQIKNIRYFGSQYWPFPNSLMLAFTAEYAGGEIVLDTDEMRAAGFYAADELPGRPSSKYSIANLLIDDFIQRQLG